MSGFGRALGNLARGALAGASTYYGGIAHEQQQERENQGALLRAEALARFSQTVRNEDADTEAQRSIGTYAKSTPAVVAREAGTLAAREPFAVAAEGRAENRTVRSEGRAENRDVRNDARNVVHEYVNDQGHPVIVYQTGRERVLGGTVRDTNAVGNRLVRNASTGTYWSVSRDGANQTDTGMDYPDSSDDDALPPRPGSTPAPSRPASTRRIRYDAQGNRVAG